MKTLKTLNLLLIVLGLSHPSFAFEALSNFKHSAVDKIKINSTSAPNVFKLQRLYQSRSLFSGLLGTGWCTHLDKSLTFRHFTEVEFNDCTSDKPYRFRLTHNPNQTSIYKSLDSTALTLKRSFTGFQLKHNEITYQFSLAGQLMAYKSNAEPMVKLGRSAKGQVQRLDFGNQSFSVAYNSEGHVVAIQHSKSILALNYDHQNHNLIRVSLKNQTTHTYQYDKYHNLTSIRAAGRIRSLQYDRDRDAIMKIVDQDGCWQNRLRRGQILVVKMSCGNGQTTLTYNLKGQLTQLARDGLGRAHFVYAKTGKLLSLKYQTPDDTERRYSAQMIPAAARGSTELDTLITLATAMTQAI
jgi:YD repeat-containing protein